MLTLEDRTTPVVSFQMWVHVGSRDEARYTGLAHLFEHMMFKGSKHVGPEEHARLIEARGGEVNAYTSNDFTVFFDDVTPETLPLVIELEGERDREPRHQRGDARRANARWCSRSGACAPRTTRKGAPSRR